jgi:hypothetical protein
MSSISVTSDYLALWGAGLSTLLAVIKVWEMWSNRFRLEVSHTFASSPEIGNEVVIRNLSGQPVILTCWELQHRSGRWPFAKFESFESAEHDTGDVTIQAHSTYTLRFTEANHFAWSSRALRGRSIVIRLCLAGRRPTTRLVFAPGA